MFCRKCGNKIPDDSIFCLKCGTKVETGGSQEQIEIDQISDETIVKTNVSTREEASQIEVANKQTEVKNLEKKVIYMKYSIIGMVTLVLIMIIAVLVSNNSKKCSLESCNNLKIEGSDYCSDHTCQKEGCFYSKLKSNRYCYSHQRELTCETDSCTRDKVDGGNFCSYHTCEISGCYNKKYSDTDYCFNHQIDMRKRLTGSSFSFSLNSAGGIKFNFSAKNTTGKEIKYVRFDVKLQNAVGDSVQDEITRSSSVSVEIVGPIKLGERVSMSDEIIGYCDTCARLDIDDITIVYTDGTSEKGHFGYYCKK